MANGNIRYILKNLGKRHRISITDEGGKEVWYSFSTALRTALYALLAVAVVGATPLVRNAALRMQARCGWVSVLRVAVAMLLLLVCTAYLVDGSFNPFLYFRF